MEKEWHIGKNGPAVYQCRLKDADGNPQEHFSSEQEAWIFLEQENEKIFGLTPKGITRADNIDEIKEIDKFELSDLSENFNKLGEHLPFTSNAKTFSSSLIGRQRFARDIKKLAKDNVYKKLVIKHAAHPNLPQKSVRSFMDGIAAISEMFPQFKPALKKIEFSVLPSNIAAETIPLKQSKSIPPEEKHLYGRSSKIIFNIRGKSSTKENHHHIAKGIKDEWHTVVHEFAHVMEFSINQEKPLFFYLDVIAPAVFEKAPDEWLVKKGLYEAKGKKEELDKVQKELDSIRDEIKIYSNPELEKALKDKQRQVSRAKNEWDRAKEKDKQKKEDLINSETGTKEILKLASGIETFQTSIDGNKSSHDSRDRLNFISKYAADNMYEAYAECFATAITSWDIATPIEKEILNYIPQVDAI